MERPVTSRDGQRPGAEKEARHDRSGEEQGSAGQRREERSREEEQRSRGSESLEADPCQVFPLRVQHV